MNADKLYARPLRRLKWIILGLVALFLTALEAYYYFVRGVPLGENLVDWLIGMVGAVVLIGIGFRVVENLYRRSQQEITERQRAEEALKESLEQVEQAKQEWESTADSLSSLICLLDDRGRIIRANRTVETWNLGRVVDVRGQGMHELFHPGCTDPACYLETFWSRAWEELAQGRPAECEAEDRILKRHLSVQVRPITAQRNGEGKETASFAVAVVHDITERKRAEEALQKAHDELEVRVAKRTAELRAANEALQREITERVRAEEAMQESKAQLERSHQELAKKVASLEALHRIGVAVSSQLEAEPPLQFIVEQAAMLVDAAGCSILLPDEETGELVFQAADVPIVGMRIPPGQGIAARALRQCTPQLVHDVTADPDHYARIGQEVNIPTRSLLAVPLLVGDRAIGVLEVISKQPGRFSEQDRHLLMTMANHAAIGIENARLYKQAQQEITQRKQAEEALGELNATLEERVHQRTFDLQILHDLSRGIGDIQDVDAFVHLMLENLHRAMPHDVSASILMTGDPSGRASGRSRYELFIQPTRPLAPAVQEEIQESLVSTFVRMGGKEVIREQERFPIQTLEPEGFDAARPPMAQLGSALHVPLIAGQEGEIEGLLFVGAEREEAFTEEQVRLLYTMANQASLFLSIRRSEEALRQSEKTARALLNAPTDRAMLIDREGNILAINEPAARSVGKSVDELIGLCTHDLFSPDLAQPRKIQVDKAIHSRGPVRFEDESEGTILDHHIYPVFDAQGNVARLAVFARDITERKRAEEALQYRLEFDRLVTDISTLFIQLTPDDLDSGIDFALQAIGQFTAVDRSYVFLFSDDGTKMDNIREWCAEGIASQVESRRDLPIQRFPWWMRGLNRLQAVHIPRVADLPPEAEDEKEFLESQAVRSLVAVPMVYSTSLVGFVGFDSVRAEKTWTEDIIALLKIVGEIFVNALERRRAEKQIRAALQEKEVLLKEIHHRVKNNLQIISSLLGLQSDYIEDEQTRQLFQDSRNRVKSMALIHEKLYQAQDLARVDFAEYIQSLARDVFRSYKGHAKGVTLKANAKGVLLGIDTAIPCGLMINELISNALKYAFPDGREGEICVELTSDNGQFTLVVRDNGVGFPQGLDFRKTESLGLKLVVGLVRQLKGTIELYSHGGTEFEIKFAAVERRRKRGRQ